MTKAKSLSFIKLFVSISHTYYCIFSVEAEIEYNAQLYCTNS